MHPTGSAEDEESLASPRYQRPEDGCRPVRTDWELDAITAGAEEDARPRILKLKNRLRVLTANSPVI